MRNRCETARTSLTTTFSQPRAGGASTAVSERTARATPWALHIPGLIAKRRGPKTAHKLSDEVLEYIDQLQALDEALRAAELSQRVLKKFGLSVHPRSIERALLRRRKKGR